MYILCQEFLYSSIQQDSSWWYSVVKPFCNELIGLSCQKMWFSWQTDGPQNFWNHYVVLMTWTRLVASKRGDHAEGLICFYKEVLWYCCSRIFLNLHLLVCAGSMAWQISSEVWNFLDQSRNYILSMCCCVGSTVNVGIDLSKIVITKLKLDKDHKTLLDWKGKGLTAEKSNLASLQTRMCLHLYRRLTRYGSTTGLVEQPWEMQQAWKTDSLDWIPYMCWFEC